MQKSRANTVDYRFEPRSGVQAQVRTPLLVLIVFLLGLAFGAYWYHRVANRHAAEIELTESTKAVLKALESPVEIRFYSLLDPAPAFDSLRAFAGRVDQLLAAYEREAAGKIKLTRFTTRSDAAADAAAANGIKAFNREKGDVCFLGVAITGNDRKETLDQLSPEWEAALEPDLSRAIERVNAARPAAKPATAAASPPKPSAAEDVRRAIPNLDSLSLAEATKTLRTAALQELTDATKASEQRVKEAEQRIIQAQTNGAEAERQAAIKELQQVQAEQTEKLKEIAARLQSQIEALQQLKKSENP